MRLPPLPAPADPTVASAHLRTLSVPLAQFVDTRYLIPVFSAAYYEATVISSHDGGLPAGGASGLLKLWFNQGGGMAFRDAVEESKSRREEGAAHFESLRTYTHVSFGMYTYVLLTSGVRAATRSNFHAS